MPELIINGEKRSYTEETFPRTGAEFWKATGLLPGMVVVVIDGLVIPREDFSAYPLTDGLELELLRFVGGG